MRTINKIIIHCTATKEGQDFTVDDIRRWHVNGNGWKDIGYHYIVYLDGSIHIGRPVDLVGAHCSGHNNDSIGVVYVGGVDANNKPKDTRTEKQKKALIHLLKELKFNYPKAQIYGHKDFSTKACPSFDAKEEYKSI